jgi:hypothetical protein
MSEIPSEESYELTAKLYATTDAMVWAKEFCTLFDGRTISATDDSQIDPGTMVGWFANYWGVITQEFANRPIHLGTWHAFVYFYHLDCSNASFHTSSPRFSPITFRLAEFIVSQSNPVTRHPTPDDALATFHLWDDPRLLIVREDLGKYEEDKGR